jgi:hypothetical protein
VEESLPGTPEQSHRSLRQAGRAAARALLRSERGIAVPTTLWIIIASMGLALAASTSAIVNQTGTVRDTATKRAIEIADSGIQQAIYRSNKVTNGTATNPTCLVESGGTLTIQSASPGQWCVAQTGDVGGGSYSYRTKASYLTTVGGREYSNVDIVSTGTYQGTSRRVTVHAKSVTGVSLLGDFAVSSLNDLTVRGGSRIQGDPNNQGTGGHAAANNNVTVSAGTICGDIQHGPSGSYTQNGSGGQCSGYHLLTGNISLAPVDQGSVATNNDNWRFFSPPVSNGDPKTGNPSWTASTRTLVIQNNETVTLGGSNYSLCKLEVQNGGILYIAAGASVKVFFDSPEACGQSSGVVQLDVRGEIQNTGGNPVDAQFLMLGSDSLETKANLTANSGSMHMILYAPRTEVDLDGNADYYGGIAGKNVDMSGGVTVTYDARVKDMLTPVIPLYTRDFYIECQGLAPAGSDPNVNC